MPVQASIPAKVIQYDPACGVNRLVYSRYTDLEAKAVSRGLSIKYVQKGAEHYRVDGKRMSLKPDQFLLVNDQQNISVGIKDTEVVEGLCVFLSQELLTEVYQTHRADKDLGSGDFPGAFEFKYLCEESRLGLHLRELAHTCQQFNCNNTVEDKSIFFELAELLLDQQALVRDQQDRLVARKRTTREELYRRLSIGREYLLDNWNKQARIPDAAREAALSEYHFYRLFRSVFSCSPQQYLAKIRLERAYKMLQQSSLSITEIAENCGFYDVHHFNKSFRKAFDLRPSAVRL